MRKASQLLRLFLLFLSLRCSNGAPVDEKEKQFALDFLKKYHYLSPLKNGNHNFKDAVRIFQEFVNIPNTGQLDRKTITEMHKPRCGVPDFDDDDKPSPGRVKRFSVSGYRWETMHLTYRIHNFASNGGLTVSQQRGIIRRAFKAWEKIGPVSFSEVNNSSSNANISISFVARVHASCCCKFDGTGGSIAHAFYPKSGALHFDDDEQYTNSNTTGYNLFSIALHEIGHLLGLKHSNDPKAVMYMEYKNNQNLTDEERHGIEYIYMQGTAQPDSTEPPGNCVDDVPSCQDYVDECTGNHFVRKSCRKSCGICGGHSVVKLPCVDKYTSTSCKMLKGYNYCSNYKAFMTDKCKKTCGLCAAG